MLHSKLYDPNWKKNSSPSYSGTLMTPEMQNDVKKAVHEIGGNRHVIVFAHPGTGASTFLENVVRQCPKEYPDKKAVYISLADIHTGKEFLDLLVNTIFNELDLNVYEFVNNALQNDLLKDFEIFLGMDEKGEFRPFIRLLKQEDNFWFSIHTAVDLANRLCDASDSHMVVCLDDIERLEELDQKIDVADLFHFSLWDLRRITIISSTHSKTLYNRVDEEMDPDKCEKMVLTIPSEESVCLLLKEHLQTRCEKVSEECVLHLCSLSHGNICASLELADAAMLLSNYNLSISAINEAVNYVLMHKETLYRLLTENLSQYQRNKLSIIVNLLKSDNDLNEFMSRVDEQKETLWELSEAGIIFWEDYLVRFVDPLYPIWLLSHYTLKSAQPKEHNLSFSLIKKRTKQ